MSTGIRLKHRTLVFAMLLGLVSAPLALAGDHSTGDVALDGYCPVAYAVMDKAVKGDSKFASEYQDETYYLANGKAKMMFDKSPESYVVAYDGWCATGVANGMKVESDPTVFVVRDGKTYLFSSEEAKAMFSKDATGLVAMADQHWPAVAHQGHEH